MFAEPQPTAFDLRWTMFGTHVRVHPFFWLFSAMLGWSFFSEGRWTYLVLWVGCSFVSVLLHEFGHVMVGRLFGSDGHIVLHGFGGLAVGSSALAARWQRVAVIFAGPLIQLVLFVALLLLVIVLGRGATIGLPDQPETPRTAVYKMLLVINLVWPLLNLLPIYPLDGGQIAREVLEGVLGFRGVLASLWLSIGLAGFLAVHCLLAANGRPLIPFLALFGGVYMAIFFALMAVNNFQLLQLQQRRFRDDDRMPWE